MHNMTGIRFLISKSARVILQKPVYQGKDIGRLGACVTCIGHDYSANRIQRAYPLLGAPQLLYHRFYSSSAGSNEEEVAASTSGGPVVTDTNGFAGNDLVSKVKEACSMCVDVVSQTGKKGQDVYAELIPHIEHLLATNPYIRDVILPAGGTIAVTVAVLAILPRIFRRFHKYSTEGPGGVLPVGSLCEAVPYESSFWGALELPLRSLITSMPLSKICMMVDPTTIASQFIGPAMRAGVTIALWFLHRWKTHVITRALVMKSSNYIDNNKLLSLDKFSSFGLFALGGMAIAKACGVPVQSILTVGGFGGVATAFAARDVLGNVLSGLSIQFSQPFSVGDSIKAGSVEGQVQSVGLTTTSFLTTENFPLLVPHSMLSNQAIVNYSRAGWHAMESTILVETENFDKIPHISEEIENMMIHNTNVFLELEQPYCYLSRVDRSFAELSLGCNLKHMDKKSCLPQSKMFFCSVLR